MRKIERSLMIVVVVAVSLLTGCQWSTATTRDGQLWVSEMAFHQNHPKGEGEKLGCPKCRWGEGELPAGYKELFGNSNTARLDYAQINQIERISAEILGVTITDPNKPSVRKRGLVERITALEDRVNSLAGERKVLVSQVDELFAKDTEKFDCNEFYAYADELVDKMIEKSQKTVDLINARLDVVEARDELNKELNKRLKKIEAGNHDGVDIILPPRRGDFTTLKDDCVTQAYRWSEPRMDTNDH